VLIFVGGGTTVRGGGMDFPFLASRRPFLGLLRHWTHIKACGRRTQLADAYH